MLNSLINLIKRIINDDLNNNQETRNVRYEILKYLNLNINNNLYNEVDKKNLYLKLLGGEIHCCCHHFKNDYEEGDCEFKGKKYDMMKDYCPNILYKAICNKNIKLEKFIVDEIKKHNFNVNIITTSDLQFNIRFDELKKPGKLIQLFEENTFGGLLKDKIINFIEEVRRSHPRINYAATPIANLPSEIPIAEPVLGIPESASTEVLKNAAEQRRDNIRNRVIRRKKYESKSGGSSGNLLRWNIG